ncbi:MAG TPA: hypothetical protein VM243_10055 [Phycisphaerae bacterium]|nr:hypothetical protein [Phycisphaerae bacterium]
MAIKAPSLDLNLLINFGAESLQHRRLVLSRKICANLRNLRIKPFFDPDFRIPISMSSVSSVDQAVFRHRIAIRRQPLHPGHPAGRLFALPVSHVSLLNSHFYARFFAPKTPFSAIRTP